MDYIAKIVEDQRRYFLSDATKPIAFRIEQLKILRSALKESESEMIAAIALDFKKSPFDTYTNELALLYSDIDEAISKMKRWTKVKKVRTNLVNFPAKSYIIPEPLGVSLVIGAWNYPYQLSLAPIIPAIAAGCTVILKPSELPSNTSRIMAKIISAHFDPCYIAVVEGGIRETTNLLEQNFDKIFFTGSVPVGRIVYQAAAKNLTPVTLELGGKSPAFITESARMKMPAKRLVWSKFLNSGQTCIAPDYVLVHSSVKQQFLDALIAEIKSIDFSFEQGTYVQIINERNFERLEGLIDHNKVYYGGKVDKQSRFIEPTVMTNVNFSDKVMLEEIFGPILPVIEYSDLADVISKVKQGPRPLSCYIYTEDKHIKERILKSISFGGGAVNDGVMHITNPRLPFGGVRESGMGSYHGDAGFRAFTHYKSILDKPTWIEFNLKYYPHTPLRLKLIKKLLG
ncbi:aldehyde dehydrogenase [Chryseobacterium turcicum]|uniref:Aldehyde dehydrogenase n=1 Tax=Chryseobacterium turcicum TaxID=2898076 RepID=A0A9Q3YW37_9FLAO|nr:aldehyde dehydrogenase [Chryseobacterium turcicum]MCD1117584.1 aldehyde dehydrogenase [Chryseobacterium turcicum]